MLQVIWQSYLFGLHLSLTEQCDNLLNIKMSNKEIAQSANDDNDILVHNVCICRATDAVKIQPYELMCQLNNNFLSYLLRLLHI